VIPNEGKLDATFQGSMFERGVAFLESDPAACQLTIGVDATPALKFLDRSNDIVRSRIVDEQISRVFNC